MNQIRLAPPLSTVLSLRNMKSLLAQAFHDHHFSSS